MERKLAQYLLGDATVDDLGNVTVHSAGGQQILTPDTGLVNSRLHALHYDAVSGKYNFFEVGGAGGGIISIGADDTGSGIPYFAFATDNGVTWGLFGSLTGNNRYGIAGSQAWEFTTTPFVGTNAIFHAGANKMTSQADSTAADVATLKADFNALLAKLRTAGLMA